MFRKVISSWVTWVALAIAILATLLKASWNESMIERQDDGFVSSSVSASKSYGLFVHEYQVTPDEVTFGEAKMRVRSAWLENYAEFSYKWIWFFKPKPTLRHRIVAVVESEKPGGAYFTLWKPGSSHGFTSAGTIFYMAVEDKTGLTDLTIECHYVREIKPMRFKAIAP